MADTISYIKVGNENHPIDAITVNGITLTSAEKTLWNNKQDALTFDSIPTENSGNPITSGGIYTVIKDNEYVIAAAINDINTRLTNVESGEGSGSGSGITSESDPMFASSPAAGITAADISNWRSMSSGGITSESDPVFAASVAASITASDISNWNSKTSNTGTLTGVKFNGTNATVSNGVASISVTIPAAQVQSDWNATTGVSAIKNKPTIPAAVTEAIVSGWGFTKNTGTLTGITFNGTSVSPSGGVVTIAESDPVFAASVAASITASDISNWNSKQNGGSYVLIGDNNLDGVPINIGAGPVSLLTGSPLYVYNDSITKIVSCNAYDWSGIVRTSASGRVDGLSTLPTHVTLQDDLNYIWNKVPDATNSADIGKIIVATYDSTNGYHWEKTKTMPYGNVLNFPGSLGTLNIGNGMVYNTGMTNWSWIEIVNPSTGNSIKTLQDDLDAIRQLPAVTSSDLHKILTVEYDSISGYHWEKAGDITLYNNGRLIAPGSVGTTYLDTSGVYKNDRSSWDWIMTGTGSTSRTLQSDLNAIRQLPAVTSTQNGQVLQVVNGQWTLVTPVSIYSGSSTPNNSQGTNGDLYLQTS